MRFSFLEHLQFLPTVLIYAKFLKQTFIEYLNDILLQGYFQDGATSHFGLGTLEFLQFHGYQVISQYIDQSKILDVYGVFFVFIKVRIS